VACSRNDALGNVAVMLAALGVFGTGRGWPDLVVAAIMAVLALSSGISIIRLARAEACSTATLQGFGVQCCRAEGVVIAEPMKILVNE